MIQSKIPQVLNAFKSEQIKVKEFNQNNLFVFGKEEKLEIEVAQDLNTKIEAYQLIYRLYKKMGYANDDNSMMWYSLFNALANTTTLVIRNLITHKVVATLSIVIDGPIGLPLEDYYPVQMQDFRSKKRICAEIISLGFDESIRGSNETLLQMFKFAYLIANSIYEATDFLIKIKPNHAFFYKNKLLFQPLGEEVICSKMNNGRAKLYHLDLIEAKKMVCQDFPQSNLEVYQSCVLAQNSQVLIENLKEKVSHSEMTISDLEYLFIQKKDIFINTNLENLIKISSMYKNKDTRTYLRNISQLFFETCLTA